MSPIRLPVHTTSASIRVCGLAWDVNCWETLKSFSKSDSSYITAFSVKIFGQIIVRDDRVSLILQNDSQTQFTINGSTQSVSFLHLTDSDMSLRLPLPFTVYLPLHHPAIDWYRPIGYQYN